MRFSVTSDLHLEFYTTSAMHKIANALNSLDVDIHLIAGDISPKKSVRENLKNLLVKDSMMVMGNHDYYHGKIDVEPPIEFLNVDGVNIVGTTLWTSFNNNDPMVKLRYKEYMSDYKLIDPPDEDDRDLTDIIYQHHIQVTEEIFSSNPDIVVTHHCPVLQCIDPKYSHMTIENFFYASNLFERIVDSNIKYWICGHTHHRKIFDVGNTKIVLNPRGYPNEVKQLYTPLVFELE